jgi:hypothetical protein
MWNQHHIERTAPAAIKNTKMHPDTDISNKHVNHGKHLYAQQAVELAELHHNLAVRTVLDLQERQSGYICQCDHVAQVRR